MYMYICYNHFSITSTNGHIQCVGFSMLEFNSPLRCNKFCNIRNDPARLLTNGTDPLARQREAVLRRVI